MLEQALQYLKSGLQAIPAAYDKRPLGNWRDLQNRLLTESELRDRFTYYSKSDQVKAVGFLTGKVSDGVEVIDVDCKYDISENRTLYSDLKKLIDDNLPEIADQLVIVKTRSGGYHLYYRCETIGKNQKLAKRPPSPEELEKNPKEQSLVLIETRGEGGFIVAPPTPGYTVEQGSFEVVPEITIQQRTYLLAICRSFTQEPEEEPRPTYQTKSANPHDGLSPFADYNQRGDIINLLLQHGWIYVSTQGQKTQLRRPGNTDAKTSGNFHEGYRKLYIFSSSTDLSSEQGLSPSDIFIKLECNDDKREAARRLLELGYGTSSAPKQRIRRNETPNSRVNFVNAEGQFENLATDNVLTEEKVKSVVTVGVFIYFTDSTPTKEVLDSLNLLQQTSAVRVYLAEVASLDNTNEPLETYRPGEFKAQDIINRFAEYKQANEGESTADVEDVFIAEFIAIRQTLTDPLELASFKQLWLNFGVVNDLPITEEYITAVEEKIKRDQQQQQQNQSLSELLDKTAKLQQQGDLGAALKELLVKGKEISTQAKTDTFKALVTPISEADIAKQLERKPADILTGYYLGEGPESEKAEREIRLPAGAISIIAGATSHGKTAFLLNFAVNAARNDYGKNIYVLGYEESGADMTIRAMNAYINTEFGANNRRIIASHYRGENYFKSNTYTTFEKEKQDFFTKLIAPGRLSIQSVDYDSDALIEAIWYLHKQGDTGGIFIDYMQLLRKPIWKSTRQEELKQICLDLKDAAKDTGIPIVLAAQFNRKVINAARMHPVEIGEAGDIERVANVILGLWNNDKRSVCSDTDIDELNGPTRNYRATPGLVYVDLLKNRGGKPNLDGMLNFNGNTGVLSNYERPNFSTYPSDPQATTTRKNSIL